MKLSNKLHLSDKAERALLDDWGFEGYASIEDVLDDREYLEELGYSIEAFCSDLIGLSINQ